MAPLTDAQGEPAGSEYRKVLPVAELTGCDWGQSNMSPWREAMAPGAVWAPLPGHRVTPTSSFLATPRLPHVAGYTSSIKSSYGPQIFCIVREGSPQEHRHRT